METKLKRPVSVWIAQIVMILCSLGFLFSLFYVFFLTSGVGIGSLVGLAIMLIINLGLSSLFIVACWGMARRRAYGRWLGIGLLSMIIFTQLMAQVRRPDGPIPYAEYENETQAIAGLVTQLVILGLITWLTLTLAFSKRVSAFFTDDDGVNSVS
jgi:hypothetical protein